MNTLEDRVVSPLPYVPRREQEQEQQMQAFQRKPSKEEEDDLKGKGFEEEAEDEEGLDKGQGEEKQGEGQNDEQDDGDPDEPRESGKARPPRFENKGNQYKKKDGTRLILREWTPAQMERCIRLGPSKENEGRDDNNGVFKDSKGESFRASKEWLGIPGGWSAVMNLMDTGWADGVDMARKALGEIEGILDNDARRRRVYRSDSGDEIDMQRVWRGNCMDAWTRRRRDVVLGPGDGVTRLLVEFGSNCDGTIETMMWRGCIAIVLCDYLELMGRPVEIVGYHVNANLYQHRYGLHQDSVLIKSAGAPLDQEKVALITALPGWFRIASFAAWIHQPYEVNRGLGHMVNSDYYGKRPGDIVIRNVWEKGGAIELLRSIVKDEKEGKQA